MAQMTAVEWFMSQIIDGEIDPATNAIFLKRHINKVVVLEKAKQMEKEQIIKSNRDGVDMCVDKKPYITGEQYYNDTYKTQPHDKQQS